MRTASLLAAVLVIASLFAGPNESDARPQYLKGFAAKYPELAAKAKAAKCAMCHPAAKKAVQNKYGQALGKALGMKNVKGPVAVEKALGDVEKEKRADGKSYGEVIEGGDLPNG